MALAGCTEWTTRSPRASQPLKIPNKTIKKNVKRFTKKSTSFETAVDFFNVQGVSKLRNVKRFRYLHVSEIFPFSKHASDFRTTNLNTRPGQPYFSISYWKERQEKDQEIHHSQNVELLEHI
jgi:hypothetical protein